VYHLSCRLKGSDPPKTPEDPSLDPPILPHKPPRPPKNPPRPHATRGALFSPLSDNSSGTLPFLQPLQRDPNFDLMFDRFWHHLGFWAPHPPKTALRVPLELSPKGLHLERQLKRYIAMPRPLTARIDIGGDFQGSIPLIAG